jgi:hypothetical protein
MRLFHATKIENVPGILKGGLKKHLDGIYLSDSIKGAALWKAVQMQNQTVAVVEVEVDERAIREGEDHSPEMQAGFGAGKSFVSTKKIPSKSVIQIHFGTIEKKAKSQGAIRKRAASR